MILQQLSHKQNGVPVIEIDPASERLTKPTLSFSADTDSRIPVFIIHCETTNKRICENEFDGFINRFFDGVKEHEKYCVQLGDVQHEYELDKSEINDVLTLQNTLREHHPKF